MPKDVVWGIAGTEANANGWVQFARKVRRAAHRVRLISPPLVQERALSVSRLQECIEVIA